MIKSSYTNLYFSSYLYSIQSLLYHYGSSLLRLFSRLPRNHLLPLLLTLIIFLFDRNLIDLVLQDSLSCLPLRTHSFPHGDEPWNLVELLLALEFEIRLECNWVLEDVDGMFILDILEVFLLT